MQDLKIGILQTELFWEDKKANLSRLEEGFLSKLVPGSCDLLLFPEMFNTGFSMKSEELAEDMDGPTLSWLIKWAEKLDCQIGGSLIIRYKKSIYNRFVFVSKKGVEAHYDKRHLFRMAGEHDHFSRGETRTIHSIKGWNILMQVCYDLRFPVFSRNKTIGDELEYDLAVYLANWPEKRSSIWSTLLQARAIENQAFCIGVNRVGQDGNGITYSGDSALIDPWGNTLFTATKYQEEVRILTLKRSTLNEIKMQFPAYKDAD